jgi:hypothetical protein
MVGIYGTMYWFRDEYYGHVYGVSKGLRIPPLWTAYSNAQSKATTNNAKPNRIARDRQSGVSFIISFFSNFSYRRYGGLQGSGDGVREPGSEIIKAGLSVSCLTGQSLVSS